MKQIFQELIREELQQFKAEMLADLKKMNDGPRYLTRKEVANYLNCGVSTVDLWSRTGKLTKIHMNGTVRFDRFLIDEILNNN